MENENWQAEMLLSFALAHIGMLAQAANGVYKPTGTEVDDRAAWLVGYLRDGTGLVTDENKAILERVKIALQEQDTVQEAA